MADRDRERIGGVGRGGLDLEPEDHLHHLLYLLLLGSPVAADHLLDAGRRIFSALDSRVSGRDHDGPACLPDGECGAGVGRLVDADMEEESSKLTALQTQQQLAIQSLSIANSSAQNILTLFRS